MPLGCPSTRTSFFQPLPNTLAIYQLTLLTQQGTNPPQITGFFCPNMGSSGQGMYYCSVMFQSQGTTQVQWITSGGSYNGGSDLFGTCSAQEWVTVQVVVTNDYGSDNQSASFLFPMNIIP